MHCKEIKPKVQIQIINPYILLCHASAVYDILNSFDSSKQKPSPFPKKTRTFSISQDQSANISA